jgi:hypothetical protein
MSNHAVIAIDSDSGLRGHPVRAPMSNHAVIAIDSATGSWPTGKVHP